MIYLRKPYLVDAFQVSRKLYDNVIDELNTGKVFPYNSGQLKKFPEWVRNDIKAEKSLFASIYANLVIYTEYQKINFLPTDWIIRYKDSRTNKFDVIPDIKFHTIYSLKEAK